MKQNYLLFLKFFSYRRNLYRYSVSRIFRGTVTFWFSYSIRAKYYNSAHDLR